MGSEAVRTYFDRCAKQFDKLYLEDSRLSAYFNRIFRQAIYQRFAMSLAESGDVRGTTILDVGCGPGRYGLAYAQLGAARVVGIDAAEGMIELAREHAEAAGVADRCQFICGDFLTTGFDGRFDVILAVGVFDYLSAPEPFLRRMVELSKGRVIATFPGRSLLRMPLRRLRYAVRGLPVYFYRRQEVEFLGQITGLRTFKVLPIGSSRTGHILIGQV